MAPERVFLSVYIAGQRSAAEIEKRFRKMRRVLKGGEAEKDERVHFDEDVKAILNYLEQSDI